MVSRTYDILGNTTAVGSSKSMTWDVLNRMASLNNGTAYTYAYRGDGMRVTKGWGSGLAAYTNEYRYDGQMPFEEADTGLIWPAVHITLLKYGLGARGIDRIERDSSDSSTVIGYPLYDTHGNNVATLQKGTPGSNSYLPLSDLRGYDAWGGARTGATTGQPNPRYCASLGHVQDDESGLVYMRTRYYDPGTGRFVSQDPGRNGYNWYVYANDNPANQVDFDGKTGLLDFLAACLLLFLAGFITQLCHDIAWSAAQPLGGYRQCWNWLAAEQDLLAYYAGALP